MAGKFRLTIIPAGFNEARRQAPVQADLDARAERIAAAAGGGEDFKVIRSPSPTRARTIVVTATAEGKRLEATDRALTRAFDSGR